MSIKRFVAATTSEALRKVRDTLGAEAVVLSNRTIGEVVEILALTHADMTALILPESEETEHAAKAMREAGKKLSENSSRDEAACQASPGGPSPSKARITPGAAKWTPEKLSTNVLQTHRLSSSNDPRGADGAAMARVTETRKVFNELKKPEVAEASKHAETPRNPESAKAPGVPRAPKGPKAPGAPKGPLIPKAPSMSVPALAPKAFKLSGPSNANPQGVPDGPNAPGTAGAGIALREPGSSGADGNLDSTLSVKKQRFKKLFDSGTRPVAENAGTHRARIEKLREKRMPPRVAAVPASDIGQRSEENRLRQIADEAAATIRQEINVMRGTLEQQLTALSWSMQQRLDPVHRLVIRQLLAAGFGGSLAHDLIRRLPAGIEENDALDRTKSLLIENVQAMGDENEILEKGGVYALVGPTGVGKTTTTAKLAARCVLRHGADKVALLTTDGYRIGGHEQLRIYGKILGVTVQAVRDTQDLTLALAELRRRHIVLIDTVGMGQRDPMVAEQTAMLSGCGEEVKRLVLLNAASNRHTLDEVAHAYCGNGLAGAIITKLDEAAVMGCALDTAIRHRLPLYYVTRGQRVPEDMELAHPAWLVNTAMDNLPEISGFAALEDEFVFSAGSREGYWNRPDRSEVHFG